MSKIDKVIQIPDEFFEGLDPDNSDSDLWKGIKRWQHDRKITRLNLNIEVLKRWAPTDRIWNQHTEVHWSTQLRGDRLDYWPSTGKWRWRDSTCHGDITSLINFIRKRDNSDSAR